MTRKKQETPAVSGLQRTLKASPVYLNLTKSLSLSQRSYLDQALPVVIRNAIHNRGVWTRSNPLRTRIADLKRDINRLRPLADRHPVLTEPLAVLKAKLIVIETHYRRDQLSRRRELWKDLLVLQLYEHLAGLNRKNRIEIITEILQLFHLTRLGSHDDFPSVQKRLQRLYREDTRILYYDAESHEHPARIEGPLRPRSHVTHMIEQRSRQFSKLNLLDVQSILEHHGREQLTQAVIDSLFYSP